MDDTARQELERLDRFHRRKGDYEEWMLSEDRKHFSGNQKVRVVNYSNLEEVCAKAGMDVEKVRLAYKEAVETGDIVFVTYEDPDDATG